LEGRSGWTTGADNQKGPVHGGVLQFDTELVAAPDGSIVKMLGASPGASTAVWIMLQVIERCFRGNLTRKVSRRESGFVPTSSG
jgi:L-2-hydroxyglutarate oxidase LhgO